VRDVLKGLLLGAFLGASLGLGVCTFIIDDPLLFPGDTIAIGAAVFGTCGYVWGDDFFEWVKENWQWFWP